MNSRKKGKGVSLKALKSVKGKEVCEESSSDDSETENFKLLVKKFRKFLRRKRNSPYKFNRKTNKKEEASTSSFNCFRCGKLGHIKAECPNLLKKQQEEKKIKKNGKGKRAYIAWEDSDSSTKSDESKVEENNLCLMAGVDQDTIVSDSDLESNPDYDQLQEAFIQIHKEAVKLDAFHGIFGSCSDAKCLAYIHGIL
uniref:CCHC-type domain-containing protein n=1 Tax=Cajanus cajan TaxID=3821 RepID=A0A151UE69_CAJCA